VSTVSFETPIQSERSIRLTPPWAVTMVRILLAAEGVIALVVAVVAAWLSVQLNQGCTYLCEIGTIYTVAFYLLTTGFAVLSLVAALWLRGKRLHGVVAFALPLAMVGGTALTIYFIRSTIVVEGSRYSWFSYQFWAVWPLVAWPVLALIVTLILGFVYSRKPSRTAGIVWPIACAGLSVFFLTYLLPADNHLVAGLHGMGVLRLPQSASWIYDTRGHAVLTRDVDPLIFVNQGFDGYVATMRPGDSSVSELCWNLTGTRPLAPNAHVPIHVDLGAVTVVPNRCPSG
jgi:hypothetical protein